MSIQGSVDYNHHEYLGGTAFGFIDADNMRKGFKQSLTARGLSEPECDCFSLERLFTTAQLDRYYFHSAVEIGQNPPQWISELRAKPGFVFRGSNLKISQKITKQEGVDVRIAIEAIKCAHKKTMTHATIFSCDGDLIPLVDALIEEGIFTTVACFNDPEIGDVSSRLRDSADSYVHVGNHILTACLRPEHGISSRGTGSYLPKTTLKRIDEFCCQSFNWIFAAEENTEIVLIRTDQVENTHRYWTFRSEFGARAWQKLSPDASS